MEIIIKGKKYGLLFGTYNLKYHAELGLLDEPESNVYAEIRNRYVIILAAIKTWCDLKDVECDVDLTDIAEWGETHWEEMTHIIRKWSESLLAGKPIKEFLEKNTKKKRKRLIGRLLKSSQ